MMSADCGFGTTNVVTGKLALCAPAGTVTLAGTVAAAGLSLVRETVKPPAEADAFSVTVAVAGSPPRGPVRVTPPAGADAFSVTGPVGGSPRRPSGVLPLTVESAVAATAAGARAPAAT